MEQLSKLIAKKVGITEAQASQAVEMVLNFLKDKLPPAIGSQLDNFIGDDDKDSGLDLDDAAKLIGGFLNKKK